ncbi:hypothetical protein D7X25_18190 [bacterium 1XD42-8]|jgi:hypothetical protein|nr:hypothetical protein [Lachnospiraceae bacterium]RKJ50451.1 hypothetical protein D7X25_18190 [bacterium 1XD42-8]
MIHVDLQPEPINFHRDVRIPGKSFLQRVPVPSGKQWKNKDYWKRTSADLYGAYNGICAYTGLWFSKSTAPVSVDHFLPKSKRPELAYEWNNYRLTTQIMNNYKDDNLIVDPFEIHNGDFILDFPSCLIKANPNLPREKIDKIQFTIDVLKLNSNDDQVQARCDIIISFVNEEISKQYLKRRYPFIAYELERQNLLDKIKEMVKPLKNSN